ncbi:hypothetical protein GCM10020229_28890 [Kitasatospora albolonga]|uniref:hypothetical protein n=1 Tax=Kitasatospora albolonga TaxID=68173 RepID=UPI0031EF9207
MTPLLRPVRCLRAGAVLLALAAVPSLTAAQLTEPAAPRTTSSTTAQDRLAPLPGHAALHGAPVRRSAPLQ